MTSRTPRILVVDDEADFVAALMRDLTSLGYATAGVTSLRECRTALEDQFVDLLLLDEQLGRESGTDFLGELRSAYPGLAAVIVSGHADLELALKAMRHGAGDVLPKPFTREQLETTVVRALDNSELARHTRYHRWYAHREARFPEIVGVSEAIRQVQGLIRRAASVNSGVVIQGESGTGKDLIAMAIHGASRRRHQTLVTRNIAAIPADLVGAELFGSKRGAFTGAEERVGLFEAANNGTLFLDEIGDAPAPVQATLLRVLEARKVSRLGEVRERTVDVRLIVATHRNLQQEVQSGRFREDLFHRLGAMHIQVPPLRERVEDIEPIAEFLLERQNADQGKTIHGFERGALDVLRRHDWPGNVRELRNVIEGAVIYCDTDRIHPADLRILAIGTRQGLDAILEREYLDAQNEFECRYFDRAIERASGNKSAAARLAGLERSVFYGHLRRLRRDTSDE
jgi:two-component system, NtrC family, response regulator GlrR